MGLGQIPTHRYFGGAKLKNIERFEEFGILLVVVDVMQPRKDVGDPIPPMAGKKRFTFCDCILPCGDGVFLIEEDQIFHVLVDVG